MKIIVFCISIMLSMWTVAYATDYSSIYERAVESTVSIKSDGRHGTGFLIKDRTIITAAHIVNASTPGKIEISGNDYPEFPSKGSVIFIDAISDVAILEIAAEDWINFETMENPVYLKLTTHEVWPGQEYIGIGNRFGNLFSFFSGNISLAHTNVMEAFPDSDLHMLDGEIIPGDSGGPIMNTRGEVIGISRAVHTRNNIPGTIDMVTSSLMIRKAMMDHDNNFARRWNLTGGNMNQAKFEIGPDGELFISEINEKAEFVKAFDLKPLDKSFRINGYRVKTLADIIRVFGTIGAGDVVEMQFNRNGEIFHKTVQFPMKYKPAS